MLINKKAAEILFRMVVSCAPFLKGCGRSTAYLKEKELFQKIENSGSEIDLSIFKDVLEEVTFKKIQELALVYGKKIIDADLIIQLFGGSAHFEKIIGQLGKGQVSEDFFQKTLFAHIAVVVKILEKRGNLASGVYRNGDLEVQVKNLIIFPGDSVNLGDIVVAHYALIVSTGISSDAKTKIMVAQGRNTDFKISCNYLNKQGGLDYIEFLNLAEGTSDIIQNLCQKI